MKKGQVRCILFHQPYGETVFKWIFKSVVFAPRQPEPTAPDGGVSKPAFSTWIRSLAIFMHFWPQREGKVLGHTFSVFSVVLTRFDSWKILHYSRQISDVLQIICHIGQAFALQVLSSSRLVVQCGLQVWGIFKVGNIPRKL